MDKTENDEAQALMKKLKDVEKTLGKVEGNIDRLQLAVLILSIIVFMMTLRSVI